MSRQGLLFRAPDHVWESWIVLPPRLGAWSTQQPCLGPCRCVSWVWVDGWALGLSAAEALIREQDESVSLGQFKFFFNYGEWAPGMLEKEVSCSRPLPVPHRASLTRSLAACWRQIASGKWDLVELEAASILRQGAALEERTLW